jgi:hypothetical protein
MACQPAGSEGVMRLVNPNTGEAIGGSTASVKSLLSRVRTRVDRRLSRPRVSTKIALGDHPGCLHDGGCAPFAAKLYDQLAGGDYDWPASILLLADPAAWVAEHRTARKRSSHSGRLGYVAQPIDRSQHLDEIYAINTSLPERQGRAMAAAYQERPEHAPLPAYPCPRHRIDEWGVMSSDGVLVAYLVLYVCGDLVMVSQILGHGDHMQNDVMYLLMLHALERVPLPATVFYNRHDSGTDGLRYFKERLGFQPTRVEWVL